MNRFADFEVWVNVPEQPGRPYPVEVFSSPAGPASGSLDLDLLAPEFQTELVQVRSIEPDLALRRKFGGRLYGALFQAAVRDAWEASRGRVNGGEFDALRLRLRADVPELAVLPWELLWDGQGFLATDSRLVLSRYLPVHEPPFLDLQGRLRLLVVIASPPSLPPVEAAEVAALETSLESLGTSVEHRILCNEPLAKIHDALQQGFHALHYLGHGASGKLLLIGDDRQSVRPIADEELAQLVQGRRELRLVVLNACHSSQAETGGLFAGVGPALVRKSVPAVIAMQYPFVQLDTASRFSQAFYRALANGRPVDLAVSEARQLLSALGLGERDWSTPVLYMGTRSGRILRLIETARGEAEEAWRSIETAARGAGAIGALADLSQIFQDLDARLLRLTGLTALSRRLDGLAAAFARCEAQIGRPGEAAVNLLHLRQEWNQVRGNDWPVVVAFLEAHSDLLLPGWWAGPEKEASSLDTALAQVVLGQLAEKVAAVGQRLARAREEVRLQIDRSLEELKGMFDRTLSRFEVMVGSQP